MPKLSLAPHTAMRITPAVLSLARLLELPNLALHQAVQAELSANPALEEVEPDHTLCPRCGGSTAGHQCPHCATSLIGADSTAADINDPLLMVAAPRSLLDALLSDLCASLPACDHAIAQIVLGSLDEHGFLNDSPRTLAQMFQVDLARIEGVLCVLRDVGPPGIAARNMRACLLAQLDALADSGTVAHHVRTIIETYLDDLGAHRYYAIARHMRIAVADVAAAHEFIRSTLWPYPIPSEALTKHTPDHRLYRTPDIRFEQHDTTITVQVVAGQVMLRLNPLYRDLAAQKKAIDTDERAHLEHYLGRARTFLQALRQRAKTLQRIGEALAIHQCAFLLTGVRKLRPLTRLQIAHDTQLHESTVCRAVTDKVAQLPQGYLCSLDDFFVAARPVQDVLQDLIAHETMPLHDGELADLLAQSGYPIARRTVAKYRDQLGILPHHLRR